MRGNATVSKHDISLIGSNIDLPVIAQKIKKKKKNSIREYR